MSRILIVDDEPLIRLDIRDILETSGYEVVGEATDGFEAISKSKEYKPDLVLMDIKMPLLDGLTASKKILEDGSASGIILLTAYSDKEFIEKAKEYKMLGYLVKPIREHALIPMVELSLENSRHFTALSQEIQQLKKNLSDRKVIEQAKGIIMKLENITEDEAYQKIRKLSMDKRTTMIEIAETLVLLDE
ncbi:ANTAR domain-containing response regulator [Suicoccus acidiformans]|uniref:ANTAR domain-containing response regulator n=1 Tax=Suicoccus acidiformans TaxID=2036206 RepID=UPI0013C2FCEC|nr:response regulator [Suicoccus acidiformans]